VVAGLEVLETARNKCDTQVAGVQLGLLIRPVAERKNRLLPGSKTTLGSNAFSPATLTELKKVASDVVATSVPTLSRIVTDPFVTRTKLVGPAAITGSGGILPV
jgi:hypothetical protein